eukprot:1078063-Rhodomonas_salina.1
MRATTTTKNKALPASASASVSRLSRSELEPARSKLTASSSLLSSSLGNTSMTSKSAGAANTTASTASGGASLQPSSDAADARLAVNVEACEERGGRELPKDAIVLGSVFSLQKKGIGSLLGIQACSGVLAELYLQGNRIHSFRYLGTMPNLVVVDLESNAIESWIGESTSMCLRVL